MNEAGRAKERTLGFFEKYLTLWVLLCMGAGIALGAAFPGSASFLNSLAVEQVNLPTAVLLFFMMYPIMVQIDFAEVREAVRSPRPVLLTLVVNWAVKPFTMFFFAWLFMRHLWAGFIPAEAGTSYMAGMILLGIAPCTAMVLVWSYLAKGFMGHTLVMVAVNSLTMLLLYAPLGSFLLGASDITIPFRTLFYTVLFYVGVALVAGYVTRVSLTRRRGLPWKK